MTIGDQGGGGVQHGACGDVVMWCWTRKLTWRSTRRVTRKWPMLLTSFLTLEQFECPYGNYKLEKGILHVNYVLKRFLVETT